MTDDRELAVMEKKGGGLIIVKETEYEGHALVDVRLYWSDEAGALMPTKKGIAIQRDQFADFVELITEAAENLESQKGQ